MIATAKSAIGIDISDNSIEIVQLEGGRQARFVSAGRVELPEGIIKKGRILDQKGLLSQLQEASRNARPYPIHLSQGVIVALPEEQVFLRAFPIESASKIKPIESLLRQAVLKTIPLPEDDLLFVHSRTQRTKNLSHVVVAATSQSLVQEWEEFFYDAQIPLRGFDLEVLATFRDLATSSPNHCVLIDIGAKTTTISFFSQLGIQSTHVVYVAGTAITDSLADALSISKIDAEKQKRSQGLLVEDVKAKNAIETILEHITKEVKRSIQSYESKHDITLKEMYIVGGSVQMPGVLDWLKNNFSQEIHVGKSQLVPEQEPILFLEASGVALRGIEKKWRKDLDMPKPSLNAKLKRHFSMKAMLANKSSKNEKILPKKIVTQNQESQGKKNERKTTRVLRRQENNTEMQSTSSQKHSRTDTYIWLGIMGIAIAACLYSLYILLSIIGIFSQQKIADQLDDTLYDGSSVSVTEQGIEKEENLQVIADTTSMLQPEEDMLISSSSSTLPSMEDIVENTNTVVTGQVFIKETVPQSIPLFDAPSLDANPIATGNPGDEYTLINKSDDNMWYHIEITDILSAWVQVDYTELI